MKKVNSAKRVIVRGQTEGPVVATTIPLSFWGGFNPQTGEIVDKHHPLYGHNIADSVFVIPYGRGSSTSSGVLLEAILTGHAPRVILLAEIDEIIALGAIVADEMFSKRLPVLVLDAQTFQQALQASYARIHENGDVIFPECLFPA
ncbi:MAG: aconitase X swivel domain-containing protein [Clostridia bacterium]